MRYRIEYDDGRCCNFANGRADLLKWLEPLQEANRRRLQDLAEMMRYSDEQESNMRTFISEILQYATITELDETVLHRLISKILIGEVRKVDGQKFLLKLRFSLFQTRCRNHT